MPARSLPGRSSPRSRESRRTAGTRRTSLGCPGSRRPPAPAETPPRFAPASSLPPEARDVQRERRPAPDVALHLDVPAQHVRQAAADGEAEARASVLPRDGVVGLAEVLENPVLVLR